MLSRWFVVPGIVGLLTFVVTVLVSGLSVVREREAGTFDQLLVTPYRPWEILVGKAAPGLLIGAAEAAVIVTVAVFWFRVPLIGSLVALALGLALFLVSATGLGLMISSIAATQQQGLLGAFLFLVPAIILSGFGALMIGRTPEYLGTKIATRDMQFSLLALPVSPALVLAFAGASSMLKIALDSLGAAGPHGLFEIVYAYASSAADNGSSFAGLNANTPWYNVTTGIAMFFGRFAHAIPILAIAGSLAAKRKAKASAGTMPSDGPLFVLFLLSVIVIVTLLQYLPVLALGPIAEHFLAGQGATF